MTKYLYLYSGGGKPTKEKDAKAQMAAWMSYFGKLGSALVDHGTPLIPASTLLGTAQASAATGFSIIQAESHDQAVALTAGHPHLANGGGIEVFEYMPMPTM
ncbi:hypothetical protein FAZ95_36890 [Trinickia violacea]|uniref:YCII-related domain-containing protein n=1 Tax=Trinickia violacea TaxID=2571746 RepID=A0A4P8IYH7_9BURK|nr:YciI family protein [Trinickia violacea]QCP54478.1 hypothetical protein FAZ95_36890 [Trinickia violacea]